jgi:hypothetical protein
MGVGRSLKLNPGLEEQVARQEVDEQLAWVWVEYYWLVPVLEFQVA